MTMVGTLVLFLQSNQRIIRFSHHHRVLHGSNFGNPHPQSSVPDPTRYSHLSLDKIPTRSLVIHIHRSHTWILCRVDRSHNGRSNQCVASYAASCDAVILFFLFSTFYPCPKFNMMILMMSGAGHHFDHFRATDTTFLDITRTTKRAYVTTSYL